MTEKAGTPIPLETRIAVQDFLIHEAELLDDNRFEDWLDLFADDISYKAPIRVTRKNPAADIVDAISYYDENMISLSLRVRRLGTDVAWAEDPPSFTRRFITNLRVSAAETEGELVARCNLLIYRSRGDRGTYDLISGDRHDILRSEGGSFKIANRRILLDQASLGTKNLGIFL